MRLSTKTWFGLIITVFFLGSCSKDKQIHPGPSALESTLEEEYSANGLPAPNVSPGQGATVAFSNGAYRSSFSGGISFGSTFTHPSNKYDYQNYSNWQPTFSGVSSNANLLDYQISGNKLTLVYGTAVNGLVYKMSVTQYFNALRQTGTAPDVANYVSRAGGNSSGLIVVAGQFVIDHSSPIGVSIFDGAASFPTQPSLPTLISEFFAKGGHNYFVAINEGTNTLFQLTASLPSDHPKAVKSYNASYTDVDSQTILVTGSFKTKDGTMFQLNETLSR